MKPLLTLALLSAGAAGPALLACSEDPQSGAASDATSGGDPVECAELVAPIERGDQYVLEFGDTYFAIESAGGKIVEFRRSGGDNLLTDSSVNELNFGATLWTAPQSDWDWPPPTALDSDPYVVSVDDAEGSITMLSQGTPDVGPEVAISKTFKANLCAHAVDIGYDVTNEGPEEISLSPWEVARTVPGGLTFWGSEPMLLLGTSLNAQFIDDTHWFDHMDLGTGKKLFAEATEGYVAFSTESDLFVRSWRDVADDAHPPGHGEVEVYEGTGYVELEVVGPYTSLSPGAGVGFDVRWSVRPLPANASREVDDAGLLRAARALADR